MRRLPRLLCKDNGILCLDADTNFHAGAPARKIVLGFISLLRKYRETTSDTFTSILRTELWKVFDIQASTIALVTVKGLKG